MSKRDHIIVDVRAQEAEVLAEDYQSSTSTTYDKNTIHRVLAKSLGHEIDALNTYYLCEV